MREPAGLRGELADRVDVLTVELHCVTNEIRAALSALAGFTLEQGVMGSLGRESELTP